MLVNCIRALGTDKCLEILLAMIEMSISVFFFMAVSSGELSRG